VKKIVLALLDHFESYLCQFLLVFFVVVILLQIVLRQINMSLPWTEEIARFAFIWFILFGACYATRLCALNRVTLQFSRAPKWVGNLFLFIGDIIWLCFSLIMAWEGYIAVLDLVEFPYATPALDWDCVRELGFGHGLPCLPLELPADGHPHRSGERHQVHPERRDS